MKRAKKFDYDVGFCKTPVHSRFQPGTSGNPKGRPKGSENYLTKFNRLLEEKIEVIENGRRKKISKAEALMKAFVNRALKGDVKAAQQAWAMMRLLDEKAPRQPFVIVFDEADRNA